MLSGLVSVDDGVALGEAVIQAIRSQTGFSGGGCSKLNPLAQQ